MPVSPEKEGERTRAELLLIEEQYKSDYDSAMRSFLILLAAYTIPNDVGQINADITNMLSQSGVYDSISNLIGDGYQKAVDEISGQYTRIIGDKLDLTEEQINELQSKQEIDTLRNDANLQVFTAGLSQTLYNQQLDILNEKIVADNVNSLVKTLDNKVSTEMTTGIFSTAAIAAGLYAFTYELEKHQYVGPLDGKTRPFCRSHIGEIKSLSEWDQLDNGQISPVSVYLGGYSCRHVLVPVGI